MLTPQQVEFLQRQGFSSGLIRAFDQTAVPLRCWIVDNSISMSQSDAHIISGFIDNVQMRPGTRWDEVRSTVVYHAHVAAEFNLPTRFTMLNSADPYSPSKTFSIAESQGGPAASRQQVQFLEQYLKSSFPTGATPIMKYLVGIRDHIVRPVADQLRRNNQRIVIVLATDGLPSSDRSENELQVPDFLNVLRSLESLPVWIVFRLCTDEGRVFDFYNSLDAQFNLPCDVLDDLIGEALEVYLRNPWLTYALPLHRLREMGFPHAIMDALDERALTLAELQSLCSLLFAANLPDPARDWQLFLRTLAQVVARERIQWNPVTKVLTPWIDLARLHIVYGRGMPFPRDIAYQGPQPPPVSAQRGQPYFPNANIPPPQPNPGFQGTPQQQRPMGQTWQSQSPPQMNQQQGIHTGPTPSAHQPQPNAFHHQPQQRPHAPPPAPDRPGPSKYTTQAAGDKTSIIKSGIMGGWALTPPNFQNLRPIDYLLGSIQTTFPPANDVSPHPYFEKFKPFAVDALASRDSAVLKRAVRKMKFFLHPDKLPRDLSSEQSLVCKTLWDTIADAWEEFQKLNP